MKKERIPGGKAKGKSLKDLAVMHSKSSFKGKADEEKVEKLFNQLKMELKRGIKIELEHTTDEKIAHEIAMDHLFEDPKYYTKLSKIEEMKKPRKISVSELSTLIKESLNEVMVNNTNYDNDLAIELKMKVGDLENLDFNINNKYRLNGDEKVQINSDSAGKVHVHVNGLKKDIFKSVDEFLGAIKYGPIRVTEGDTDMPHKDHEASMAKGELRELVKNAKSIYEMVNDGDELPGWVSSYITLASDYMNSVNQYMTEKMSGDEPLIESEESAKQMKLSDLATKYNIEKTDPSGKFTFADFQPVLDGSDQDDKYALALNIANMILRRKVGLSWDDLPDVNSLWDCIESADTVEELAQEVKQCCIERLEEEGGEGMF
jgi:hypothetical protein